jgi:hypothetical protein
LYPEDGGNVFLRSVGAHLPVYMLLKHRRLQAIKNLLRGFHCRPHDHGHYHDDEYHITSRDIAFGFLTFMIILTNLQVCMPVAVRPGVLQMHPIKLWLERDHLENTGMDEIKI